MQKSCPHCGAVEPFQRVSVIVESETSVINTTINYKSTGLSVGFGGSSGDALSSSTTSGMSSGTQTTALAKRLAPPLPPPPPPVPPQMLPFIKYYCSGGRGGTWSCISVLAGLIVPFFEGEEVDFLTRVIVFAFFCN